MTEKWEEALQLMEEDKYREAITLLEELTKEEQLKDSTAILAEVFRKTGVSYYYLDEEGNAIEKWQKALVLSEVYYGTIHAKTAGLLYNIGSGYKYVFDDENARRYFMRYLTVYDQLPEIDTSKFAKRLIGIADFLLEMGDVHQAQVYSEKALTLVSNDPYRGKVYIELGNIKVALKDYQTGLEYFKKAQAIYETDHQPTEELHNLYQNIGRTYLLTDSLDQAEKYSQEGLKVANILQWDKGAVTDLSVLAAVSKRRKNYPQTLAFYQDILKRKKAIYNKSYEREIAAEYENIGDLYLEMGQLDQAREYLNLAIATLVPAYQKGDVTQLDIENDFVVDNNYLIRVLSIQAKLKEARSAQSKNLDYLREAHRIYLKIDSLIVLTRQNFKATGSKFSQIANTVETYEAGIANAHLLFTQTQEANFRTDAYKFSARNKAIILLEGLQEQQTEKELPPDFSAQKNMIDSTLRAITLQIQEAEIDQSDLRDSLSAQYFNWVRAKERLLKELADQYPQLYNDVFAFINPLSIAEIQQNISTKQTVVEYFYGAQNLFAFLISRDTVLFIQQTKPEPLDQWCISFRKMVEDINGFSAPDFAQLSPRLFQQLFTGKIYDYLFNTTSTEELIIVPDNLLYQIPFEALLKKSDGQKVNTADYLLQDFAISYLFSTQFLRTEKPTQKKATKLFAGFGLQYDSTTLNRLYENLIYNPGDDLYLSRLLFSESEIKETADLFGGATWLGTHSSRQNFLSNASDYQIIHLSLHALINERYPEQSALVFYGGDETTSDYLLRSLEIYNLSLPADLTVLSACNTAAGTINQGEGMRSLARSFAYAGCPSIVASQWPASEQSSKDILLDFYQQLKNGKPKNQALRQAKLNYLANVPPSLALPNYWAHLILIGNPETIDLPTQSWMSSYWIWGILLVLGLLLWQIIARRR